jgi:hypothetical protein
MKRGQNVKMFLSQPLAPENDEERFWGDLSNRVGDGQVIPIISNQLFYDLSVEDLPKFRERVLKVTPEDIQRVARWFVRPDQLSVVLVGNADQFVGSLKGAGFGTFERIPIDKLDILAADLKKQ